MMAALNKSKKDQQLPDEVDSLKSQLQTLVSDAHKNEIVLRKFQALELRLLGCSSLAELIEIITRQSRNAFGWDTIQIILCDQDREIHKLLRDTDSDPERYPSLSLLPNIDHINKLYGSLHKPILGPYQAKKHQGLFDDSRPIPRSVALLPLQRNGKILGSLNLGSYRLTRFEKNSATDFLQHLAAVLATCLHTTIYHEKLKQAGLTDALTKVNNRRFFDQRLEEEVARSQRIQAPLSILFIDIDHFKVVNDSYGHEVGDHVLQHVAELIRAQLRSMDVVARYGGEEFAVLLESSGRSKASEVAQRMRTTVADYTFYPEQDQAIKITVSIGVSTLEPQAHDADVKQLGRSLLREADRALYAAKQQGRNRVIYNELKL